MFSTKFKIPRNMQNMKCEQKSGKGQPMKSSLKVTQMSGLTAPEFKAGIITELKVVKQ
jgi:hypothetical protein